MTDLWDHDLAHVLFLDHTAEHAQEVAQPRHTAASFRTVGQDPDCVRLEGKHIWAVVQNLAAPIPMASPWEVPVSPNWQIVFRQMAEMASDAAAPGWVAEAQREAIAGVAVLLRAFAGADAYLIVQHDIPALLRRHGRLVLAQELSFGGHLWDGEAHPFRELIALSHKVEPLGPW